MSKPFDYDSIHHNEKATIEHSEEWVTHKSCSENAPRLDHQCSQGVSQFSSGGQLQGSSNLFGRPNADIVSRSAAFTYSIIHCDSLLIGVSFRDPLRGAMAIVSTQPTPVPIFLSRNTNRKHD
jgi:hypothetical protein